MQSAVRCVEVFAALTHELSLAQSGPHITMVSSPSRTPVFVCYYSHEAVKLFSSLTQVRMFLFLVHSFAFVRESEKNENTESIIAFHFKVIKLNVV